MISSDSLTCDLCGALTGAVVARLQDEHLGTAGLFTLARCRRCGLAWLVEPASAGAYPAGYVPHTAPPAVPAWRRRLKRAVLAATHGYPAAGLSPIERIAGTLLAPLLRGHFATIPRYRPAGVLLDVGCGAGSYAAAQRDLGWRAAGIDAYARAPGSVAGRAEALPAAAGSVDVATFWHSLEHCESPAQALAEARRVLAPAGALMLEVPNACSLQAHIFGTAWFHLDAPRHRYHFTPATLRAYLERAGFANVAISTVPSVAGIAGSLGLVVNRAIRRRGRRLRGSRPLRALLWPLAYLEARLGRGGCLRAWAERAP